MARLPTRSITTGIRQTDARESNLVDAGRVVRRVLFGFDLRRVVRLDELERLLRREDEAVLFFATNNPSQALSQTYVQNLCQPFIPSTPLRVDLSGSKTGLN